MVIAVACGASLIPVLLQMFLSPRGFSKKEKSENRQISNCQDNQIEKKIYATYLSCAAWADNRHNIALSEAK